MSAYDIGVFLNLFALGGLAVAIAQNIFGRLGRVASTTIWLTLLATLSLFAGEPLRIGSISVVQYGFAVSVGLTAITLLVFLRRTIVRRVKRDIDE